jgi:prevent-host-death family protein
MRNMMQPTPQVEPISRLSRDHNSLMRMIANGPVWLTQRAKAAAVLVSVKQWDEIVQRMADLQKQLQAERRIRVALERHDEMVSDPAKDLA